MQPRSLPFGIAANAKLSPSKPMPGDRPRFVVAPEPSMWRKIVAWFLAPAW